MGNVPNASWYIMSVGSWHIFSAAGSNYPSNFFLSFPPGLGSDQAMPLNFRHTSPNSAHYRALNPLFQPPKHTYKPPAAPLTHIHLHYRSPYAPLLSNQAFPLFLLQLGSDQNNVFNFYKLAQYHRCFYGLKPPFYYQKVYYKVNVAL